MVAEKLETIPYLQIDGHIFIRKEKQLKPLFCLLLGTVPSVSLPGNFQGEANGFLASKAVLERS